MIQDEQKETLIKYRIEQAKETLSDAELLLANGKYRSAVNRIYYSMFYLVLALGIKHGFETSQHGQLIGWFNKNFIKDGTISQQYGKMLRDAFKYRQQSDYLAYTDFPEADVQEMYEDAKDFIGEVEQYLL